MNEESLIVGFGMLAFFGGGALILTILEPFLFPKEKNTTKLINCEDRK